MAEGSVNQRHEAVGQEDWRLLRRFENILEDTCGNGLEINYS